MMSEIDSHSNGKGEGRPYRSHLYPACFSCRKRKSRCKTESVAKGCIMCQAHGTECIFPRPEDSYQQRRLLLEKSPAGAKFRASQSRQDRYTPYSIPHIISQPADLTTSRIRSDLQVPETPVRSPGISSLRERRAGLPELIETGDDSSHIISPAVADDNDILESYLSTVAPARRCLIPSSPTSNRPLKPVRFNVVPRKPLGVTPNQSVAASKCEMIEKLMDPNIDESINMFLSNANPCFPIFDEASSRSAYFSHKEKISPALLCNLYANSLVYWGNSGKLRSGRTPDTRFIWNQANEALHSELFLSPGISTVMAIIINVCGRPSTSMFGNGGMVGTAVALSNALGLNRDPSGWSISPLERSFRIRIWWLVVIHDRWCSLAYGTPLQVHRAQYDVPFPSVDDVCPVSAASYQRAAASVFLALTTLTDVLACYLEHVYSVSKRFQSSGMSELDLEHILSEWEESLSTDVRRIVLRGTCLDTPGAANLRLAYLGIKLLLRRIQLDLNKDSMPSEDEAESLYYMHAQRAAEEIVHLVQELDESQCRGFWIPVHAFSLTSATMFLLRSGLRMRNQSGNNSLKIARDMINTLQAHRRDFDWDLADNCLGYCSELVEKIDMVEGDGDTVITEFPDFPENLDMDASAMDEFFGMGFSEGLEI